MTASYKLTDQVCQELLACHLRLIEMSSRSPMARRLARLVGRLHTRMSRPPRVVLLGEFNAGKTTLANALIGAEVLPTSFQINTRVPIHVHFSERPSLVLEGRDHSRHRLTEASLALIGSGNATMLHVGLPVERLRSFEVIDTPGLASGATRLDRLVTDACGRASIAVWCTASTQAWKATEEAAWAAVPLRLRRLGLLVATLSDALNTDRDRDRLLQRLRHEASPRFHAVGMIAGAEADEIRRNPAPTDYEPRWNACGGAALERLLDGLIENVLASRHRTAQRVLARCAEGLSLSASPELEALTALPRAEPVAA